MNSKLALQLSIACEKVALLTIESTVVLYLYYFSSFIKWCRIRLNHIIVLSDYFNALDIKCYAASRYRPTPT